MKLVLNESSQKVSIYVSGEGEERDMEQQLPPAVFRNGIMHSGCLTYYV